MREPNGHVTVNERVPSERFNRFVDESIRAWMYEHQFQDEPTEYEVAFFEEDALGEVSCLVVVQSGAHLWRSWETADNPRLALSRSLESMREDNGDDQSSQSESVAFAANRAEPSYLNTTNLDKLH